MNVQRWNVTCANEYGLIQPKARMALPMQDGEWVRYDDYAQALAEKDREIQQIREHEFQSGYQEAEGKYQQLMEKAINFAKTLEEEFGLDDPTSAHALFLNSPEVQAWKEQQK